MIQAAELGSSILGRFRLGDIEGGDTNWGDAGWVGWCSFSIAVTNYYKFSGLNHTH